ncbi:dTDP-glucose 4,6-dehydratase [Micromonospora qiuiae]|uniref:dTDP-glucose 4,6-dehydratase n=1 Tax=Micromonospora qiuiae TaxID=502268 RepID=A0ABQ4JCJ7_9ACTN|nr:dTDP-glucose 4,6-dehydratase [Micromonospora qiuiae]GIJ27878.1 dTDP-glucose 4,6-dehydratase [Micromonospora qiuiae]
MRILVTGGAGFIGSHFTRCLLDGRYLGFEGSAVTVLDKLTYASDRRSLPATHPRLTFVRGDVADVSLLREVVPGHDVVVHFAAESHVDRSIDDPAPFFESNVMGSHRLMAECVRSGVSRVVHVSTDEVYGSITEGSWDERCPMEPNSPYAASKAASDCVVRSYWRTYDLDVSITRCANNYGPYQHVEKVIPRFVTNLLTGRDITLHGDGSAVREWLHVDDHCRAIALVLAKGRAGEVYNIGGDVELTNRALAERILLLAGADWDRVRQVADRKVQDQRYSLDYRKISEELNYEPRIRFADGLAEVFQWYREHRDWWAPTCPEPRPAGTGRGHAVPELSVGWELPVHVG